MAAKDPKQAMKVKGYAAVREFALSFPEAYEEFPWGHCAIKVRKKIFVTMGADGERFTMSLKLTDSNFEALLLPFTEPTHYGMGKHGWVTSSFPARANPPMPLLRAWIEESYRAIAPKKLVSRLDEEGVASPTRKKAGSGARKAAAKAGKKTARRTKAAGTTRKKTGAKKAAARGASKKATGRGGARKTTRRKKS